MEHLHLINPQKYSSIKTSIPRTVFDQIIQIKSSPETTAALLNEMEEKYSVTQKHWNAKRVYPFWKICTICQKPYPTYTKEQALRNKTCSPECNKKRISVARTGKLKPLELRKIVKITCPVCGKQIWKPDAWVKRIALPTCSRKCNGILRGEDWKAYAHTGRAGWSEDAEERLRIRMTGSSNPAWKGGVTYFKTHGNYIGVKYVRCPEKYKNMARKDGYIMEHRLIMAQHLGRCLKRTEVIHHRDHDPSNNKIENLMIFRSNQEHKAYEWKEQQSQK